MHVLPSRLACVLVVGVLIAACDHKERVEQNPAADDWTELSAGMNARLQALRERQKTLGARIASLAVPQGTEDVTLTATIAELQGSLGPVDEAVGKLEAAIAQATVEVTAQLRQQDKRAAQRQVDAARAALEAAVAAAEPALAPLEPKLDAAEQIMQRLTAVTEAELTQLRRLAAAGGTLDFTAVDFQAGAADLDFTRPAAKATLDRLVQFAAVCPQLRFAIAGFTSKDAVAARNQALGLARAEAVKAYLIAQGVDAAKIVRTGALGAAPTPDDRISVEVVTSCAAPAPTAPPTPPTAPAPTAAPPTAPRPAQPIVERPVPQQPPRPTTPPTRPTLAPARPAPTPRPIAQPPH